jgi:hypothetical protein
LAHGGFESGLLVVGKDVPRTDAIPKVTGTVDHPAFTTSGLAGMRTTLSRHGITCCEHTAPSLGIQQAFFEGRSGATLELNYPAAEAAAAA